MDKSWKKVFVRKDCDLPTFDCAIRIAHDILKKHAPAKTEYLFAFFKDDNIYYYLRGLDEIAAVRSLYKRKFFKPEQIKTSYKVGLRLIKKTKYKTTVWAKKLQSENPMQLAAALADFTKDFLIVNYKYSILPWWALESWQSDFLEVVNHLLTKRKLIGLQEEILAVLLQPWKKTAIQEIRDKFAKGVKLNALVEQYQFLRSWTVVRHKPINQQWIKEVGQRALVDSSKERLTINQVIKLLKPNQSEKQYLITAPFLVFFKDWRDDLRRQQVFLWAFLFEKIAGFFNIPREDLCYLTLAEISQALNNGSLDKEVIESRKKYGCVLTAVDAEKDIQIIGHSGLKKYKDIIDKVEQQKSISLISGIVGQKGKVVGRVVMVRQYADVFQVPKGSILVANTTHPNYLAGMKKAAAFVTDEGGIACHAAIVAREMKKPCIVGTKMATKIFKDNDLVEVDADKGIVRKIK